MNINKWDVNVNGKLTKILGYEWEIIKQETNTECTDIAKPQYLTNFDNKIDRPEN